MRWTGDNSEGMSEIRAYGNCKTEKYMETVKMKWSNTTICLFEHGTNLSLLIEIPVIGASELSSGVFLPSEICMSNSAKNNTIAFKFIMCVYSYQNWLNPCLEGSELTDPAPDIANEEVLSLHLVKPALYCILDPCFQT